MPNARSLAVRMQDGDCVYGMFVFSPDPAHTELAGLSGFDFVIVDLEHAPQGIYDVLGYVRAAGYGFDRFSDYVERSNDTTLAIGLIEDVSVADRLDEVLSSVRLDVVMAGPGDLAASLGLPGELVHLRVRAEVDRIVDAVQARKGSSIGAYVNSFVKKRIPV